MILNLGAGEEDENQNRKNSSHSHRTSDAHQPQHRMRMATMKRQDSWSGFKDRAFRVASTVVLPRNMRTSCRDVAAGSMRSKAVSISVKSLPQMKRDEDARARRKLFTRSISEEPRSPAFLAITPVDDPERTLAKCLEESGTRKSSICFEDELAAFSPRHLAIPTPTMMMSQPKRVLFVPTTSSIDEVEEEREEESPPSSQSSHDVSLVCAEPVEEPNWELTNVRRKRLSRSKYIDFSVINAKTKEDSSSYLGVRSPTQPFLMGEDALFLKPKTLAISSHEAVEHLQKISEKTPSMDAMDEEYFSEEEEESLAYEDYYNCMPPPIFMFIITIVEVGFFIYYTKKLINNPKHGYIGKYSPAPLDSSLIYNPTKRHEIWRYMTYAFVHSGYMHIINNIAIQLVLGILLEIVHKWWRVLCIYFAGVIAGSLATSITEPFNYLAGASAGVYALIAAHLSTVILNWKHMEYPWARVCIFVAFLLHDGGTAIYFSYIVGEKTNVGYSAHLGGAVAGLLVGIHVLKNLQWSRWELILWYTSIVMCFCLLAFAIVWNIVRTDLFP